MSACCVYPLLLRDSRRPSMVPIGLARTRAESAVTAENVSLQLAPFKV